MPAVRTGYGANRTGHMAAADGGRVRRRATVQAAPRVAAYNKPKSRLLRKLRNTVAYLKAAADEIYPPSKARCGKMNFSSMTKMELHVRIAPWSRSSASVCALRI